LLKPREQWGPDLDAARARDAGEHFSERNAGHVFPDLKNRFYTVIPIVREDIMSALKNKGVYTSTLNPPMATASSPVSPSPSP
jgi:hypothetical protein